MAILTGGVFTSGAVGLEGITQESAPSAFGDGYLKPTALVRQRGKVPDYQMSDAGAQLVSTAQTVELYLYQDRNFDQIDLAVARLYKLFQGYSFSDSFPVVFTNLIDRTRDTGALSGASLARMDWIVYSIMTGA
jgi:hypothetical protein